MVLWLQLFLKSRSFLRSVVWLIVGGNVIGGLVDNGVGWLVYGDGIGWYVGDGIFVGKKAVSVDTADVDDIAVVHDAAISNFFYSSILLLLLSTLPSSSSLSIILSLLLFLIYLTLLL